MNIRLFLLIAISLPGTVTADECRELSTMTKTINLSSGVYTERAVAAAPLAIELPIGTDKSEYAACLKKQPKQPHGEAVAYFERVAACSDEGYAEPTLKIGRSGAIEQFKSSRNGDAWRACIEGTLEVEATLPASD